MEFINSYSGAFYVVYKIIVYEKKKIRIHFIFEVVWQLTVLIISDQISGFR